MFFMFTFLKKNVYSKLIQKPLSMIESVYKRIQQLDGREIRAKVHSGNSVLQIQGIVSDVSEKECCIGHKEVHFCDIEPSSLEEV